MLIDIEYVGFKIFKTLIWSKNTAITNMWYMDSHEYIIFARKGRAKKINNNGDKSILFYNNPNPKMHPTEKPVNMIKKLILNSSQENDTILDLFMGAGSTAIATIETNRNFIGIEIDENYFNITKNRIKHRIKLFNN